MNALDRPPVVYVVRLQSAQHDGDAVHALRAALKVLLRRFRLRCISVEEQQQQQEPQKPASTANQ
jgi:hypothetical protein